MTEEQVEQLLREMFKIWAAKRGNLKAELQGTTVAELMANLFRQVYTTGHEDGLKMGQELVQLEILRGALKYGDI